MEIDDLNDNIIKQYLEIWQEIKAIKTYLRHLNDKLAVLQQKIENNNIEMPKRIGNYRIYAQEYPRIYLPNYVHEEDKQKFFEEVNKIIPNAAKLNIHPATLMKYYDMGMLDGIPKKYLDLLQEDKQFKITIKYLSDEEGQETETELLSKMQLINK